jgi:hypothetical protein
MIVARTRGARWGMLYLDFTPLEGSKIGELAAKWDIVVGFSPKA